MKKIVAILFLFVIFFNLYGYRAVIGFIQARQEAALLTNLDKEAYEEKDLISIKTAIALPYYSNSESYERVDGTITLEGVEHKYVKRRIYNDSLELLCLPNKIKKELDAAKDDFFQLTHGHPATDGTAKNTTGSKPVEPDFCNAVTTFTLHTIFITTKHHAFYTCYLPAATGRTLIQPPDVPAIHC